MTETICGTPMPDRLWLHDMGSGDIEWSCEAVPDGEKPLESVEYVRVAALASPPDARAVVEADVERAARAMVEPLGYNPKMDWTKIYVGNVADNCSLADLCRDLAIAALQSTGAST